MTTVRPASQPDVVAPFPAPRAPGDDRLRLALPGRSLLLVGGLPGAGKSTLLAALDAPAGTVVLDSGTARAAVARLLPARTPYPAYRWLVHLAHRATVLTECLGRTETVVVHLPATRPSVRAALRLLARLGRRRAVLLWLDVPPDQARDGQRRRGRVVRERPFARHVRRAERLAAGLRAQGERGWDAVRVTDRVGARGGLVLGK
ncbi:AAA family ATPase [Pseudonocardia phyllosphaerae]|uniref:AAA family ATPase n=1 Tax=Pseudonocardia phyllosphaerae TaxID=3390502 RepID=UPI00397A5ABA